MPHGPDTPPDPRGAPPADGGGGAPLERTSLAWNRTALAIVVNGALLTRAGIDAWSGLGRVPGLVAVGVGALLLALVSRGYRQAGVAVGAGRSPTHRGAVRAVGLGTVALSLATLVLTWAAAAP